MRMTLFILVTSLVITPVAAIAAEENFEIRVKTADLDLKKANDRGRLQARLKSASRRACAMEQGAGIRAQSKYRDCIAAKQAAANQDRDIIFARETVAVLD